ncbi:Nuclear body protein SP140 [Microtus ochrogaster]|uniref:Nuclear body protein SP140 n=1 Tax=Microtus ochrogaster TaxID=79684 RepID=A0A8J6GCP9_MICOH|nr:Nuclear body protein SP140 [Microtus ochrogaster]
MERQDASPGAELKTQPGEVSCLSLCTRRQGINVQMEQLERIKASSPSTNILAAPLNRACSVEKSLYFGFIIDDIGYNQVQCEEPASCFGSGAFNAKGRISPNCEAGASSEYLSEEESPDYGLIFKYFRENKVEIASAITKPFPFLMSLRDRGYISEQKFRNYQQSCENQIPPEIVYDILSDLQNKFSLPLMKVIFSPTHLKAYPDLKETLKNCPNEGSSSCEQMFDGQEPQDNRPSSAPRPEAGAERSTSENEMCSCVMCPSASVQVDPEARMESSQSVPKRCRNKNACFNAELLPVTCGEVKGTLHKDKFKQGIFVKSIQSETGGWYTPTEFENLGGHGRSKNWKLSLRCCKRPLKFLIQVLQWRGEGVSASSSYTVYRSNSYGKSLMPIRFACHSGERQPTFIASFLEVHLADADK